MPKQQQNQPILRDEWNASLNIRLAFGLAALIGLGIALPATSRAEGSDLNISRDGANVNARPTSHATMLSGTHRHARATPARASTGYCARGIVASSTSPATPATAHVAGDAQSMLTRAYSGAS